MPPESNSAILTKSLIERVSFCKPHIHVFPTRSLVTTYCEPPRNCASTGGAAGQSGGVTGSPVSAFQTCADPSSHVVTIHFPSPLKVAVLTWFRCLSGRVSCRPVGTSQTIAV